MRDAIEEYGSVIITAIVGAVALVAIGVLIKDTGLLARFAELYSDYFYGA